MEKSIAGHHVLYPAVSPTADKLVFIGHADAIAAEESLAHAPQKK